MYSLPQSYNQTSKCKRCISSNAYEVEGIPEELLQSDNTHEDVTEDKPKRTTPHKGSIMVTIRTREGLCIQKKGLDYQGLKTLVEKLEGLC